MTARKIAVFLLRAFLLVIGGIRAQDVMIAPILAQGDAGWIYALIQGNDTFILSRTDGVQYEELLSIPSLDNISFASIAAPEEINRMEQYLVSYGYEANVINSYLQGTSEVRVLSVAVAPDNETVAINLRYEMCTSPYNYRCFGTNRIMLFESSTQETQNLYEISITMNESSYDDTHIEAMHWTPDQATVIVALLTQGARLNSADANLIAVPLTGASPLELGTATMWDIAPNSHQIAMISGPYTQISLTLTDFDLVTRQVAQTTQSFGTYFPLYGSGMVYTSEQLVFHINHDEAVLEGGGGTALFTPSQNEPLNLLNLPTYGVRSIQSTTDANHIILESADRLLYKVTLNANDIELTPISSQPTASWILLDSGYLLIQFESNPSLQLFDPQGQFVDNIEIAPQTENSSTEFSVLAIDG